MILALQSDRTLSLFSQILVKFDPLETGVHLNHIHNLFPASQSTVDVYYKEQEVNAVC